MSVCWHLCMGVLLYVGVYICDYVFMCVYVCESIFDCEGEYRHGMYMCI